MSVTQTIGGRSVKLRPFHVKMVKILKLCVTTYGGDFSPRVKSASISPPLHFTRQTPRVFPKNELKKYRETFV